MAPSVDLQLDGCHRVIPEKSGGQLRVDLRKAENSDLLAELGGCLDFARRFVGWTLDQLARELAKDARQVQRWIDGKERTQVDVVFSVRELQAPFILALARWAQLETETTVKIRRSA